MNSKVIYATVFLTASLTMVVVNYSVFYPDNVVDIVEDNESNYNAEAYDSANEQSFWDKFLSGSKEDIEPEIALKQGEVTILNTEKDALTDDDLIDMFGANAQDKDGNILPITVSTDQKSDTLVVVTFTAVTEQETTKSIDGNLYIEFNNRPKLSLNDRKIKISQRKYEKLTEEELTKYVIRKAGIKCDDKEDGKVEPAIDFSNVSAEPGEYKLKVTATDSDEQESSIDVILTIT